MADEIRHPPSGTVPQSPPPDLPRRQLHQVLINFGGMVLPLGAAFLLLPIAARELGPTRFGILSLGWALTEYLGLLELGVGRASIRFVASALARQAYAELREIISASLLAQLILGSLGAVGIVLVAPFLAGRVFNVPAALVPETVTTFYAVAVNLPIVLLLSGLRAVLEGASRFDLSVAVRVPTSIAAVLIPAVGAAMGASLPEIFIWLAILRAVACVAAYLLVRRALHGHRPLQVPRFRQAKRLWAFSGWAAVSSFCSSTLVYLERFALAAAVGVTAVGFYTAPYEAATRFLVIPISVVGVLYPLLTRAHDRAAGAQAAWATGATIRYIVAIVVFPMGVLAALAPDLLTFWMGPRFAEEGAVALRILALGVVINAAAHPPYIALYAANRPDIVARNHLLELVLYVPVVWTLTKRFGINGAALAWTLRVTGDALLLWWGAHRVVGLRPSHVFSSGVGRTAVLPLAALIALAFLGQLTDSLATWAIVAIPGTLAYGVALWLTLLTASERGSIRDAVSSLSATLRSGAPDAPR